MEYQARTQMTLRCRDCDDIPKVPDAGRIIFDNGERVQVMHNGLRVIAGGYHGDWMADIITGLKGHHEPQEERVFHALLRFVRPGSLMIELGAFWAYYTLWFLRQVPDSYAICIEPDANHIQIGRRNATVNGLLSRIKFLEGWAGGASVQCATYNCESTNEPRLLPSFDMVAVNKIAAGAPIEILHIDAQGAELPFLQSVAAMRTARFLVVSTHHKSISGSATTYVDCLAAIRDLGGHVLVEHDIGESFSGDGLIVASLYRQDSTLPMPSISRNAAANSLFPDLAKEKSTRNSTLTIGGVVCGVYFLSAPDRVRPPLAIAASVRRSGRPSRCNNHRPKSSKVRRE